MPIEVEVEVEAAAASSGRANGRKGRADIRLVKGYSSGRADGVG